MPRIRHLMVYYKLQGTGKWPLRWRKTWTRPRLMPAGPLATRKINQQNGKTNLRPEMNNPKETPKRPVAIAAKPDTQGQSAQPVTRIVTNVVRKAIMELYANCRRLVLVEVATEVVPGQEDPE